MTRVFFKRQQVEEKKLQFPTWWEDVGRHALIEEDTEYAGGGFWFDIDHKLWKPKINKPCNCGRKTK